MKKILAMLLALVMVLSLAACASTQPAAEPAAHPPRAERPTPSASASSCSMRRSMPQRRASLTH